MTAYVYIGTLVGYGLFCGWLGTQVCGNAHKGAVIAEQRAEIKTIATQAVESNKVETVYVDRIERVEVPVDRVRRILVAGVCPATDPAVVSAGDAVIAADGAAASPADAELVDDIARDAESCIRNAEQLTALQALIRANTQEQQ